jgi:hypothetical protein
MRFLRSGAVFRPIADALVTLGHDPNLIRAGFGPT